ncbi:hypothetical protein [Rhodococcus sp. SGAir0479]|nr:hypothetical protein [Rhodococcus sp. SGAir0479]
MRSSTSSEFGADRHQPLDGIEIVRYPDPSPLDGWWAKVVAQRPPAR